MTEVMIRPVKQSDFDAISRIYAEAVETTTANWEWKAPSADELLRRYLELREKAYPYIVGEVAGELIGYAYASPFNLREGYQWVVEDSVYIHPDHFGRGHGSVLLAALIEICTAQSYRHMLAVIGSSDNTASIKLHEKNGFDVMGKVPGIGWKLDNWQDWVLMARPLGLGTSAPPTDIIRSIAN
ncbi:MAG: N-acetyltransferase family protein [Aquisalinus sp.]|nr:N-acetyltransferase family protein [Aquisalinus sp.]